jgi:DNA-directed RNA polymerase specialized sigma subunit|tara:strand:- start:2530 stop:3336 length:807 start_codon:yes stop_codon:yes gene_type:complete
MKTMKTMKTISKFRLNARERQLINRNHDRIIANLRSQLLFRFGKAANHFDLIDRAASYIPDAVKRYDPQKSKNKFEYITQKCIFMLIDELRSQDPMPRIMRNQITKIEALRDDINKSCGHATADEIIDELNKDDQLSDLQKKRYVQYGFRQFADIPLDSAFKAVENVAEFLRDDSWEDGIADIDFRDLIEEVARVIHLKYENKFHKLTQRPMDEFLLEVLYSVIVPECYGSEGYSNVEYARKIGMSASGMSHIIRDHIYPLFVEEIEC